MLFSSTAFVFIFLPAFIGIYSLSPLGQKNTVALAASLIFYGWGAPHLVVYLVLACAVDFGASRLMARWDARSGARRGVLGAAIALNLGLLAYFKYANFFVEQLDRILGALGRAPVAWTAVALPIGISFFTFHRVSYLV